MIQLTINGQPVEVETGSTILDAVRKAGFNVPTLCYHPKLVSYGSCRLCLVEVEGARTLQPSCVVPAGNNMVVHTDTDKTKSARKFILSMIFSERNHFCMYWRGVKDADSRMTNSVMRGSFLKDANLRREFLALVQSRNA